MIHVRTVLIVLERINNEEMKLDMHLDEKFCLI